MSSTQKTLEPICGNCRHFRNSICKSAVVNIYVFLSEFDHEQRVSFKPDKDFSCSELVFVKPAKTNTLIIRHVSYTYIEDLILKTYSVSYDILAQEKVASNTLTYSVSEKPLTDLESEILAKFKDRKYVPLHYSTLGILFQDMVNSKVLPPREYSVVIS